MTYNERLALRRAMKEKLKSRQRIFGGWVSYTDVSISETFAKAGFDFIVIDMEHTTISLDQAKRIITSVQSEGACCLPRPVSHTNDLLKPLLEAGADGMFIQMVETEEQVRRLIDSLKFPPLGRRSYGVNRAHGYGLDFEDYIIDWNDSSSLILQIESIDAVNNINELLSFPEVDGVMIGPYDISGSLGVPGQTDHPKVREASRIIIEAANKHSKSCCIQISDASPDKIADAFEQGFTFLVLSSDLFVLSKWAVSMRDYMEEFRK